MPENSVASTRLALSTSPATGCSSRFLPALRACRLAGSRTWRPGAFLYAALFLTEGAGLWLGRRWAEYLTLVATASLVPIEVFEAAHRFGVARLGALAVNPRPGSVVRLTDADTGRG